jgi:hypothetical protein
MCCGSCASYAIHEQAKNRAKKFGKYPKGNVFYNRQSTQSMYETGVVYLSYSGFETRNGKTRKESLTDLEVGELIVDKMSEVGLLTQWERDASKCVLVDVEGVHLDYAEVISKMIVEDEELRDEHMKYDKLYDNCRSKNAEKKYLMKLDEIENRMKRLSKRIKGLRNEITNS